MKAIKALCKIVGFLLAVVLIVVLAHPVWIGPVVKGAANSAVPKVTKTGFYLGELDLNLYRGRLHVGDMQLQNPERFFKATESSGLIAGAVAAVGDALSSSATNAVGLTSLDVSLSTLSALTDTIHINEIALTGLEFYGDLTFSNIREIADNASGGKKPAKDEPAAEPSGDEPAKGEAPGKKVVIDRVFIAGTKIQWGHVVVQVSEIEILDIGKDSGGASEEGAFKAIVDAICDAADKVCSGAGSALKVAIEGAGSVANAVGAVGDIVGDAAGAMKDAAGAATGAMKDAAGAATDAMKGAAGDAAGAVKDAAGAATGAMKDATGAMKDAFSGATGAAGDTMKDAAGSATDAMKSAGGMATDAMKSAGSTATDAMKSAGGAMKNAAGMAGDAMKGAAGAAGDAAGAAVNAVKGLFN